MRGDEHDHRRRGQALDLVRQRHAVLPRHVDVQQHHVKRRRLVQQRECLAGVTRAHDLVARVAFSQQRVQALARQQFVVHNQNAHGPAFQVAGRAMRTRQRPSCRPALNSPSTSCSSLRRARTFFSAMPLP